MKNNLKYKDTIFRYLFKDRENFVHLYKDISGNDLTADDVEFYDTYSLFVTKELQNDVSFLTKDNKLIILVEHQSTISANMALRLLIYYVELLKIFITNNNLNVFSNKPIKVPSADFYVVFNGDADIDNTTQELVDNFCCDLGQVKVRAKIKNINYDKLKHNKDDKNNFIGYAFFVDKVKKYKKLGFELHLAFEKAKTDCLNEGFLLDYLNKKEFLPMAMQVYTIEQEMLDKENFGYEKGREAEKIQMVKELLSINISLEDISRVSKLSIDELLKIKEHLNQESKK